MKEISGKKIVVFGGNGTLGQPISDALARHGAEVTIFSRHAHASGALMHAVRGSVADESAVHTVLKDAGGVVFAVEADWTTDGIQAVYVDSIRHILETMRDDAQIVFMSNIGVTNLERMPEYNRAKQTAEELIRTSHKRYTIVRPAWIVGGSASGHFEQGDSYIGRRDNVSGATLGETVVAAFEYEEAHGKTFELYGGGKLSDWQGAFMSLHAD